MHLTLLALYPPDDPRHGGQHRLYNLRKALMEAGHTVDVAGVLGSDQYPATRGFLPYPKADALRAQLNDPTLMEDWAIGKLFATDSKCFNELANLIDPSTEAIHVEQPWLFQFAELFNNRRCKGKLNVIYGSQNIEHMLKREIARHYRGEDFASRCADIVLACERNAIKSADLVVSVSDSDDVWIRSCGAKQTVIARNGIAFREATTDAIAHASNLTGNRKYALFVGSDHPPNVFGFFDIFHDGVGALSPNQKLVVAGAVGRAIRSHPRFPKSPGLPERFIDLGILNDQTLAAVIENSHAIILPITKGEGTNIKTAEALLASKHIIATSTALRGFESFAKSSGVNIADQPQSFASALRDCMNSPPLEINATEMSHRHHLLWGNSLIDFSAAIKNISNH